MVHDYHQLARTCEEIAVANGFAPATWEETFPHRVGFAITELDEAQDAAYGRGDDTFGVELADVAIRILATLNGVWGDDWCERINGRYSGYDRETGLPPGTRFKSVEQHLWPLLKWLTRALDCWAKDNQRDAQQCLELCLLDLFRLADRLSIRLIGLIDEKCEVNRKRAERHGKVRATC